MRSSSLKNKPWNGKKNLHSISVVDGLVFVAGNLKFVLALLDLDQGNVGVLFESDRLF